jgi:enoyl-CoA hydratase/carnithine racemase
LPLVVMETLRAQVPVSSLLPIALEGRLFAPGDARAVGLVHDVVPPSVLMGCALARAEELAALPTVAAQQVKRAIRRPVIERIEAGENGDAARWVDTWFSEGGQRLVREAVARLKGGKA